MVRFTGVIKRYDELTILDGLDFDMAPQERVAIIGPSGSGKSTLLRVLMALEPVDGGLIEVDGESLTHRVRRGRKVPADNKHLRRVRGNVTVYLKKTHLPIRFELSSMKKATQLSWMNLNK